jgi:hypothetical protein
MASISTGKKTCTTSQMAHVEGRLRGLTITGLIVKNEQGKSVVTQIVKNLLNAKLDLRYSRNILCILFTFAAMAIVPHIRQ